MRNATKAAFKTLFKLQMEQQRGEFHKNRSKDAVKVLILVPWISEERQTAH